MQDYNDVEYFPSQDEGSLGRHESTVLGYHNPNTYHSVNHVSEANSVSLTVELGFYIFYISFDTSCFPSSGSLFEPLSRQARSLRRWRCEGFFLLAWLLHVCLVWALRALEASEGGVACTKNTG